MDDAEDETRAPKTATQVLAALVARRRAAAHPIASTSGPHRQAERAAAARSASKSKPAMKKP